jgi:membrane associated rhomboid family serine protease/Zn-finger nucleic acid-binding protein
MALCPRCKQRLVRVARPQGIAFQCPQCQGCAVGISVLRKWVPNQLVNDLWLRARQDAAAPGAPCAICDRSMAEVPVRTDHGAVALDVCPDCQFVWFDTKELEQLPAVESERSLPAPLPEKAREQIALAQLKTLEAKERGGDFGSEMPAEGWKWIPAFLGLPVEMDASPTRSWAWLTWALAAAMACTYALTARHLQAAVDDFGLVPAQLARHGGLTFVTSFFLHGGFFHLLSNAYFLLIFGDNVEDELGRWRYFLLIAAAALAGEVCHILADPRGMVPCIGASGGIAGVIAFYALQYPRARLGFLWRLWFYFRWIYIPAWAAMVVWLLLQGLFVVAQLQGRSEVSALAHMGGFGVGVVAWLLWRVGHVRAEGGWSLPPANPTNH